MKVKSNQGKKKKHVFKSYEIFFFKYSDIDVETIRIRMVAWFTVYGD